MAGHARFGGGDAREGAGFRRRVAEAAVNAVARDVTLVAEGNGLLLRHADLRDVRRPIECRRQPRTYQKHCYRYQYAGARKRVCAFFEYLCHAL